ncbi:MAG: ParA family protein [Gammaproteobacteria bacterium]
MRITALFHQKGGTGKTTLAIASALVLAPRERVLLLDLDPQGTATTWGDRFADRHGIVVRGHGPAELQQALRRFEARFDHCILDCPPNLGEGTLQTLAAADQLIIPVRPALPDIWALERVAALIEDIRPGLPATVVFNQHQGQELSDLMAVVEEQGLKPYPDPIALHPAWSGVFTGTPPPAFLTGPLRAVLASPGAP